MMSKNTISLWNKEKSPLVLRELKLARIQTLALKNQDWNPMKKTMLSEMVTPPSFPIFSIQRKWLWHLNRINSVKNGKWIQWLKKKKQCYWHIEVFYLEEKLLLTYQFILPYPKLTVSFFLFQHPSNQARVI